jgi:voltage-gated sodium channel
MGISRPVMEQFPYAWLFFVPFILVATFTVLNLFIAIIVNAMQTFAEQDHAQERQAEIEEADRREAHLQQQLTSIHEEVRQLRELLIQRQG